MGPKIDSNMTVLNVCVTQRIAPPLAGPNAQNN